LEKNNNARFLLFILFAPEKNPNHGRKSGCVYTLMMAGIIFGAPDVVKRTLAPTANGQIASIMLLASAVLTQPIVLFSQSASALMGPAAWFAHIAARCAHKKILVHAQHVHSRAPNLLSRTTPN
jgi:hypothetical protein